MATPVPERETITLPPDGRPAEAQPAWRQDFPIDWPQDEYVERRDFVKFLTLTSLAFVAGQLWIAGQSLMRRRRPPPGAQRIASRDEIAAARRWCSVTRAGTTAAFSSACPTPSSWRSVRNAHTYHVR